MALISVDITNPSDHDKDEFIKGFRSILAMKDYDDPYVETPWCAPWTYTDSIKVESDELIRKDNYFALGRIYAFKTAPDIVSSLISHDIETEIQECMSISDKNSIDSMNDYDSSFLELEDLNDLLIDEQDSELSGIIFPIKGYAQQFIEALEPDLDVSYIGAKESFDIGKIDKNNMICFDSDNCKIDLDNVDSTVAIFLNKLCELATEWRDFYVQQNYAEQNEQINHCGLDANSTENNLIKKKSKSL